MRVKIIVLIVALFFLVGGSVAAAVYFYTQMTHLRESVSQTEISDQTTDEGEEIATIVAQVGDAMELPLNEEPTLATVIDKNALQDQPFFVRAENGDKVLIYTNARKAILYRPSTDKIIDVAPIYFAPEEDEALQEEDLEKIDVSNNFRVSLYMAGAGPEQVDAITLQLRETYEPLSFVPPASVTGTHQGITIVDVSGVHSVQAQDMATLLGGTLGQLPEGVSAVDTDIIVVLGIE